MVVKKLVNSNNIDRVCYCNSFEHITINNDVLSRMKVSARATKGVASRDRRSEIMRIIRDAESIRVYVYE